MASGRIIFLFLLFLAPCMGKFNHTVGPIAHCSTEMKHPKTFIEGCVQRCNRPAAPSSRGSLAIYQETSDSSGPRVVQCTKLMITQVFTETWTFSQLTGAPEVTILPISPSDCKAIIKEKCPDLSCNIRAPHHLTPEFHYASDTKLAKTFINAISLPSSIDLLETSVKITPMGVKKSFDMAAEEGSDGGHAYIWSKRELTQCPFKLATTIGCDYYGGNRDTFECRGSKVVIENVTRSTLLKSPCGHLNRSTSGLLYSWTEGEAFKNTPQKKLYLTGLQNEAVDVMSVRVQTADALSVLDEDMCQIQCDILELHIQLNLGREFLTRLGGKYVLITKTGYIRECDPVLSCELQRPHNYCGGPARVGVTCGEKGWMWNPLKSYVEDGLLCHRVHKDEALKISIGGKTYDVGSDMHVNMSETDSIGLSHDLLGIRGVDLDKGIVNVNEMRESWVSGPHMVESNDTLLESLTNEVDHWDILGEGWNAVTGWGRIIKDLFKKTYVIILLLITVLSTFWYLSKVADRRNANVESSYSMMTRNRREEQPVWM